MLEKLNLQLFAVPVIPTPEPPEPPEPPEEVIGFVIIYYLDGVNVGMGGIGATASSTKTLSINGSVVTLSTRSTSYETSTDYDYGVPIASATFNEWIVYAISGSNDSTNKYLKINNQIVKKINDNTVRTFNNENIQKPRSDS